MACLVPAMRMLLTMRNQVDEAEISSSVSNLIGILSAMDYRSCFMMKQAESSWEGCY